MIRDGTPVRITASLMERIEEKIERIPFLTCWIWIGAENGKGYGQITFRDEDGRKRTAYVHRLMYEQANGRIPAGGEIDHLCREHSCVRPDHLELVSHRENALRGMQRNVVLRRSGLCKQGHRLEDNRVPWVRGCHTCINARKRRKYAEANRR